MFGFPDRSRFHIVQNGAHPLEFRVTVQWLQSRVSKHLEEPWAARLFAFAQFRDSRINVTECGISSGCEGAKHKSLPAQPLHALQSQARVVMISRADVRDRKSTRLNSSHLGI